MEQSPATEAAPCRLSISTMTLGYASGGHLLQDRLKTAQRFGYKGIELYYEDVEQLAASLIDDPGPGTVSFPVTQPDGQPSDVEQLQLLCAASMIRAMCDEAELTVICLQPLRHFEGLLDRALHKARLAQLALWCHLARLLRTDLILIPSSFLPADQVTTDFDAIARDLREAADLAAASGTPPVRLCYEALAWGTAVCKWQQSYDIVKRVDRANFGLCLDTFNIAARDYAEPILTGGDEQSASDSMAQSIRELVATVNVAHIFLVQAADGALCHARLYRGPETETRTETETGNGTAGTEKMALQPLLSWSRNHRLFCAETEYGASLPTMPVLKAIFVDLGYRGWLSHELFSEHLATPDAHLPNQMAHRGVASWEKILQALRPTTARPVVSLSDE